MGLASAGTKVSDAQTFDSLRTEHLVAGLRIHFRIWQLNYTCNFRITARPSAEPMPERAADRAHFMPLPK
jgi:hypothetical protein